MVKSRAKPPPSRQARRRLARATSSQARTPVPTQPIRRLKIPYVLPVALVLLIAAVGLTLRTRFAALLPKPLEQVTSADLAGMSDKALARLDPLVMNLIVARGIPGLESLDIPKYAKTVDEWASTIDKANKAAERFSKEEATYKVSREFWMAGGMAVMLAGPRFGIAYTSEHLDESKPEQQFAHGIIDDKRGTCATMPVLYMAIGHRLGWPIKGVVSRDHMWARWDDGKRGGQRFNLDATNADSNGADGSFASLTDQEYADWLKTAPEFIQSGSDMTSLTARQLLGVFLQSRAGYWRAQGNRIRQREDLALAVQCFPQNIDIRMCYESALRGPDPFADFRMPSRSQPPRNRIDVDRINRENLERLKPPEVPQTPNDPIGTIWNGFNPNLQPPG